MSVIEKIINDLEFSLPIVFNSDDFRSETNKFLMTYITELKMCGIEKDVIDRISSFKKSCSFVLSNFFKGIHYNAYENFEKALDALNIDNSSFLYSQLSDRYLFRGRINHGSNDYPNEQMFHIPLNKRWLTNTQRYSFPGLPCLYAGASVFTCWAEMNKPSFEQLQLAALKPTELATKMKVVDLSHIPERLDELRTNEWFSEKEYLLYLPLLALCSIKVKHEDQAFKPEYIFPQFFLEYIMRRKNAESIIGIKYISNKAASVNVRQFTEDWSTYVNYVFPTRSESTKDVECEFLSERFVVERNRSGKELQILSSIISQKNVNPHFVDVSEMKTEENENRRIYTRDGSTYLYKDSTFGMIEQALLCDDFDREDDKPLTLLTI